MALASSRGDGERAAVAELRATALQPRLSRVVYDVSARNDMPGFELRRNGLLVSSGSWGVALPSDAGSYEVVAKAPGYRSFSTTLEVRADVAEPLNVRVPELPRLAAGTEAGFGSVSDARSDSKRNVEQPANPQKTWGAVTFGIGAALAATSGVLTFMASRKDAESKQHCRRDEPNLCEPDGLTQREDAQQFAGLATWLGIGGGVLITTGATLYLTSPSSERGIPTGLGFEFLPLLKERTPCHVSPTLESPPAPRSRCCSLEPCIAAACSASKMRNATRLCRSATPTDRARCAEIIAAR